VTKFSWSEGIAFRISLKKPFRRVAGRILKGKKERGSEGVKEETWVQGLLKKSGPIILRYYQDRGGNGFGQVGRVMACDL
jgi:hypothetical protein